MAHTFNPQRRSLLQALLAAVGGVGVTTLGPSSALAQPALTGDTHTARTSHTVGLSLQGLSALNASAVNPLQALRVGLGRSSSTPSSTWGEGIQLAVHGLSDPDQTHNLTGVYTLSVLHPQLDGLEHIIWQLDQRQRPVSGLNSSPPLRFATTLDGEQQLHLRLRIHHANGQENQHDLQLPLAALTRAASPAPRWLLALPLQLEQALPWQNWQLQSQCNAQQQQVYSIQTAQQSPNCSAGHACLLLSVASKVS